MCVVPISWNSGILMVFGGTHQNDSPVCTCGIICSKESVSLDLYTFFDHFRHQDIRSNGLEQSDSNIKGVGTAHTRILHFVASSKILLMLPLPTRSRIRWFKSVKNWSFFAFFGAANLRQFLLRQELSTPLKNVIVTLRRTF